MWIENLSGFKLSEPIAATMNETERSLLLPILIILGLLALGSIWIFTWGGYGFMGPSMIGGYYGGWGWMPMMMIIFWAFIGVGVYLFYRSWTPNRRVEPLEVSRDNALAIARERLAKGEITAEEYEIIKKTLEG